MARNDQIAADVRRRLEAASTPSFNFISSPGAGKTLLLERTLAALNEEMRIAVVTGDCQTQNDADRLARHTDRVVQAVVTHGGCHLDARQIETAVASIDLDETDLLLIENVGNLVCPAAWDLGETAKIVLFSVTEGEDKPAKYPKAFQVAKVAIITKIDLLPHVDFDLAGAIRCAREVNPVLRFVFLSARTGAGMEDWLAFLRTRVAKRGRPVPV
jgi:hydrogenase nickel incorporation protein HypB